MGKALEEELARRGGFERFVMSMAREAARQQKAAVTEKRRSVAAAAAEERRLIRKEEADRREQVKLRKLTEQEFKRQHLKNMEAEATLLTTQAAEQLRTLNDLLAHTLGVDDTISFDSLRVPFREKRFQPPASLQRGTPKPAPENFQGALRAPTRLAKLIPGATRKFAIAYDNARHRYDEAVQAWERAEQARLAAIDARKREHDAEMEAAKAKASARDAEVDAFRDSYLSGDPDALIAYNTMVLERSEYPEGFPQNFSIAYTCASKMLVVEYELPSVDIVPKSVEYRYVRTRDVIDEKARKSTEVRAIYQDVIAAIALRTMHEIFEADQADRIEMICFNGFIHAIDPATG